MIATSEGYDIEDLVFTVEVVGRAEDTSSVIEPEQWASTPGITPLKVVLVGLILDGSIPILRTMS